MGGRLLLPSTTEAAAAEFCGITRKLSIILNLWNDFIHNEVAIVVSASESFPIIVALRVCVQTFRGHSLCARGLANVMYEPTYPEAMSLCNWRSNNLEYLQALVKAKPYFNAPSNSCSLELQRKSTIVELITSTAERRYNVSGKLKQLDDAKSYYYDACPMCYQHTTALASQEFTCHNCDK